jgi:pimeloyl-ACP methyl ester carboxylesterase
LTFTITASINFWEPIQLSIIQENFRWYSLSLPGHFPAIFPDGFQVELLTGEMIAAVISKAIINLVGEQPVLLIGHSTGGVAALEIAARMPGIVAAVASISGFANGKWGGALGTLQKMAQFSPLGLFLFKISLKSLVAKRFIYRLAAGFYAKDKKALYSYPGFETIFDLVYRDAIKLDASSMFPYFNRLPDIDISKNLPLISSPTHALAGACDPIVPKEQSHITAKKVPQCKLHILREVGHLPMLERPVEYNSAIEKWVKRIM